MSVENNSEYVRIQNLRDEFKAAPALSIQIALHVSQLMKAILHWYVTAVWYLYHITQCTSEETERACSQHRSVSHIRPDSVLGLRASESRLPNEGSQCYHIDANRAKTADFVIAPGDMRVSAVLIH